MNEGTNVDAYVLQEKYCSEHGYPVFISRNCCCPRCGRNIFGIGGYTINFAGTGLITSCPFCNDSFCE